MASPGSAPVCAGSSNRVPMCAGRHLVPWQSRPQRVCPADTAIASRNLVPKGGGQAVGREHIHLHAQQLLQFKPDRANVHQRGLRGGLHQQVEIAVGRVIPMQRRAKHPHAAHAVAQCDLADLRAVEGKGFGGAHGLEFSGAACF